MSNIIIAAGLTAGGIALGMREDVRKSVKKAAGVTSDAVKAGKQRFTQTEASLVETETVTTLPRQASS
ncbi:MULTISPECIES: hypothetical protein [Pseudomonadota]|uniref:hypothetical protein n=1 Tax=Pseudomonadota TaxID=1224 RepID=UPI0026215347|nr:MULTISPECIES: hypothetical protein [Pseudomonadota]